MYPQKYTSDLSGQPTATGGDTRSETSTDLEGTAVVLPDSSCVGYNLHCVCEVISTVISVDLFSWLVSADTA